VDQSDEYNLYCWLRDMHRLTYFPLIVAASDVISIVLFIVYWLIVSPLKYCLDRHASLGRLFIFTCQSRIFKFYQHHLDHKLVSTTLMEQYGFHIIIRIQSSIYEDQERRAGFRSVSRRSLFWKQYRNDPSFLWMKPSAQYYILESVLTREVGSKYVDSDKRVLKIWFVLS